jgi:hypothetical protein
LQWKKWKGGFHVILPWSGATAGFNPYLVLSSYLMILLNMTDAAGGFPFNSVSHSPFYPA